MPGTGPPPKHPDQRARVNHPTMTRLPAGGRTAPPPEWPLSEPSPGELVIWTDLWATPMALMWERMGWVRDVALYCRIAAEAEAGDTKAAGEARLRGDRLGLNPLALLRLQWEIVPDQVGETRRTSSRKTLALVEDDGALEGPARTG